jgi:hypothetical protein
MFHRLLPLFLFPFILSCTQQAVDDSDTDSDPKVEDSGDPPVDTRPPGEDQTVTVFDAEYVFFGSENRRTVDIEVSFPDETATYSAVTGNFKLHCPNNRCDWWDRYATFGIVLNAGTDDAQYVELDRFITPYRVGFSWETDLTAVRPLLTGTVTMRVFIDTWVGEGHEQGDGWLFDASVAFTGGEAPSPEPIAVIPVWPHQSWSAGLDDSPVEGQVIPQSVTVPEAESYTFRSFITGHGWNNQQNCAEFCSKEHFFTVNGQEYSKDIWRKNCGKTVTDGPQMGTWEYDRAGWCPGAQVNPWEKNVTDFVGESETVELSYRLEDFTWLGDGDQPYYYLSGLLIAWR